MSYRTTMVHVQMCLFGILMATLILWVGIDTGLILMYLLIMFLFAWFTKWMDADTADILDEQFKFTSYFVKKTVALTLENRRLKLNASKKTTRKKGSSGNRKQTAKTSVKRRKKKN